MEANLSFLLVFSKLFENYSVIFKHFFENYSVYFKQNLRIIPKIFANF